MPAIFPVAYFGPISYYQKMVQAGEISFELHEHYVKQTLRNRMMILAPNGIQNLSIPVIKPQGNKTLTKNIQVSNVENWQKNHWKAIETAYSPSPYFEHYGPEVKELIDFQNTNLVDFNQNIHHSIVRWLGLNLRESFTDSYIPEPAGTGDFRNWEAPGETSSGTEYVQVFSPAGKFVPGLSILDAIFNLGPMARTLLI